MVHEWLTKLQYRDAIDQNFSQLFPAVDLLQDERQKVPAVSAESMRNLKQYLVEKDKKISHLQDVINATNRDTERLNDELLSANIENNLLQEKLLHVQKEYDSLIERWLLKAQREADTMNSRLK